MKTPPIVIEIKPEEYLQGCSKSDLEEIKKLLPTYLNKRSIGFTKYLNAEGDLYNENKRK